MEATFAFSKCRLDAGAVSVNGRRCEFAAPMASATLAQRLAGMDGETVRETFSCGEFDVTREIWCRADAGACALRYLVRNARHTPFVLSSVKVVDAAGDAVGLADAPVSHWRAFLDSARAMGGFPSAVRLGVLDETYQTAAFGLYWGYEEHEKLRASAPTALAFDNYCVMDGGDDAMPKLLAGFIELGHHYADMRVATDASRTVLAEFSATATFDCELAPNETRATGWFLVAETATHNEAQSFYANAVARLANVDEAPSARPPAVGCTWHYYGGFISEKTVLDNAEAAVRRNIPLDYYLVDDFWEPFYGDWEPVPELFPNGMRFVADNIRAAGMKPGIWTSPFAVKPRSKTAALHDDILFRDANGEKITFYGDYMIDPTAPGALAWVGDLYRRLHQDWGFEYFKLDKVDFPSYEFRKAKPVCRNRSVTLVEAYRMMLCAVREAVGPASYICVCGGHYGASIGLCDTQRSSCDTYGRWRSNDNGHPVKNMELRLKQTLGRLPWRRIWHTNPDGLEIRRQEKSLDKRDFGLSVGLLTDDEATLATVAAYVAGGIVMCGESLVNLDDERLAMYRRVVPSLGAASSAIDLYREWMPSQYATHVVPACRDLASWNTVSVLNVADAPADFTVTLSGEAVRDLGGEYFAVFENVEQRFFGIYGQGGEIELEAVPAHAARVLRIMPVPAAGEVALLSTDLHFSGGGVEIAEWKPYGGGIRGRLSTPWRQYPVRVWALRVVDEVPETGLAELKPGETEFEIVF